MFLEQNPGMSHRHTCCWRSRATPQPRTTPRRTHASIPLSLHPRLSTHRPRRELKKALEARWADRISDAALLDAQAQLRKTNLARLVELGLGASDASLADAPSLYDQVLDITLLLGAVPERFRGREGLDLYFALARGDAGVAPQEMTKWFDTNYHYLVPEIEPQTPHLPHRQYDRPAVHRRAQLGVRHPPGPGRPRHLSCAREGQHRRA